ncbi:MAG: metal-dependent transcriptional regulator [Candidatus Marsarchaeota archaeon]|nr:metal-dependent transcriptional regulator [Candidatus Marsarchaeota archaeon]
MGNNATHGAGERSSVHHYLLAIYQISKNKGVARTTDIATVLKVSSPSVTNMLERLTERGLITHRKYQGARLAPDGEAIVKALTARANVFKKFFKRIDVPEHLIDKDAHVLEAGLSVQTMRQMERFVRFVDLFGEDPCFFAHFKRYCAGGLDMGKTPFCGLKLIEDPKRARPALKRVQK